MRGAPAGSTAAVRVCDHPMASIDQERGEDHHNATCLRCGTVLEMVDKERYFPYHDLAISYKVLDRLGVDPDDIH